jgi:peptidoglycan/LPS O-acetylase OafA/YrhL
MTFAFYARLYPFNIPAWSLAYEMVANIGFAASVRKRVATPALIGVCALSFGYLLVFAFSRRDFNSGPSTFDLPYALARVGFSFSAGALLFNLYSRHSRIPLSSNFWAAILALVFAMTLLLQTSWTQTPAFRITCMTLVLPAIVYASSRISVSGSLLAIAVLLGDMSYPLYVLHEGLIPPVPHIAEVMSPRHPHLMQICGLTTIAVVASASWIISKKFELPLRRKLTQRLNQAKAT